MFASVSSNVLEKLIEQKDCENTKNSSKSAVKIFRDYLFEKKLDISLNTLESQFWATYLGIFMLKPETNKARFFTRTQLSLFGQD